MTVNYNTCHKSWNTCVVFPSPILIWVLQSSQCPKIRVAQHCGRRGAHLTENNGAKSERRKWLWKWDGSGSFKMKRGCCDLNLLSYLPHWVCVFSSFCCGLVHELDLICRCNNWVHPNTPYKRQKTIMFLSISIPRECVAVDGMRLTQKFPSASFKAINLFVYKEAWTLITRLEYCIENERWTL